MKGQTGCRPIKITLYGQVMKHHFPSRSIVLPIHLPPRLLWSEMEFICIISARNCNHGDKRRQTQWRRMDGGRVCVCAHVRGRWAEDSARTGAHVARLIQLKSFVTLLRPLEASGLIGCSLTLDRESVTTMLPVEPHLTDTRKGGESSIYTVNLMFHQSPLTTCLLPHWWQKSKYIYWE